MNNYHHLFTETPLVQAGRHFAAHSHHPWPDCTRRAQDEYWQLSSERLDEKWDVIFGEHLEKSRHHIARILNLSSPQNLTIAPNTHELVERVLSSFLERSFERTVRVLTTDQEFHSFRRQAERYAELPGFQVDHLAIEPFEDCEARLLEKAQSQHYDLIFLSQVVFSSGFTFTQLEKLVAATKPETTIMIDGYHAFGALEVDLQSLEKRIHYVAGGYKYAMSGEGFCFMHSPAGCNLRPLNTGWFADLNALVEAKTSSSQVRFANDGSRFSGSTLDLLPAFRFNAVQDELTRLGLGVREIHQHVEELKAFFVSRLRKIAQPLAQPDELILPFGRLPPSHFLTFRTPLAETLCRELRRRGFITDFRGDRWRIGFGLYHSEKDVLGLLDAFKA